MSKNRPRIEKLLWNDYEECASCSISEYKTCFFWMDIFDKFTCLTCHPKSQGVTVEDKCFMSFDGIWSKLEVFVQTIKNIPSWIKIV